MVDGAAEVFTIVGVGIVGYIGSTVLEKSGKEGLSKALDIVVYISGMMIALKFWQEGVRFVETMFHVRF